MFGMLLTFCWPKSIHFTFIRFCLRVFFLLSFLVHRCNYGTRPRASYVSMRFVLFSSLHLSWQLKWTTIITNWNGFHHHRALKTIRSNYEEMLQVFYEVFDFKRTEQTNKVVNRTEWGNFNGSQWKQSHNIGISHMLEWFCNVPLCANPWFERIIM